MEDTMKDRIPRTDSIQELAAFWQNHDVTDFEDELEEAREPVFQRTTDVVGVPLTTDERQALRQAAATRGVAEAELIHEWVRERLRRT
jgi:CopG antitoxin of type II toxin-antitoxin system